MIGYDIIEKTQALADRLGTAGHADDAQALQTLVQQVLAARLAVRPANRDREIATLEGQEEWFRRMHSSVPDSIRERLEVLRSEQSVPRF